MEIYEAFVDFIERKYRLLFLTMATYAAMC